MSTTLNRDALHRYLYRRTDRVGRIKLNVQDLANEIDVSYWTLTRIVREMTDQGRLRQIGGRKRTVKTYVVNDPAPFEGQGTQVYRKGQDA